MTKHGLPVEQRFWMKVAKSEDGCWMWTGVTTATTDGGHGKLRVGNTMVTAHRLAWTFAHGPIPAGLNVLHKCDVPACVRADHLYLGTQRDNTRDAIVRGRYHRHFGQAHPRTRLTDDDVRAIRARAAAGETYRLLAKAYSVTFAEIGHIVKRRVWIHVD
jgi:HNH endonuclease